MNAAVIVNTLKPIVVVCRDRDQKKTKPETSNVNHRHQLSSAFYPHFGQHMLQNQNQNGTTHKLHTVLALNR